MASEKCSLQKTYNVVKVFNKRHCSWICHLSHTPEPSLSFSFSPEADTWLLLLPSAGGLVDSLILRCSVGWRGISDIEHFHFGHFRAASAVAAVVVMVVAVLGLAWTGTAGPRLHDDGAFVL